MKNPAFVILAAGMGTRLGKNRPKSLTMLDNGETIMERQIASIKNAFGDKADIYTVVGYKMEEIIESFPDNKYVVNSSYDSTNTSKSLLQAFQNINIKKYDGVVWLNGDVVFDADVLFYLQNHISAGHSVITVDTNSVAVEEVKYMTDALGYVTALSKDVPVEFALGESVGINYVCVDDFDSLKTHLANVDAQDYFEKGIENSIAFDDALWKTFDITSIGLQAIEVDFLADLVVANNVFS